MSEFGEMLRLDGSIKDDKNLQAQAQQYNILGNKWASHIK